MLPPVNTQNMPKCPRDDCDRASEIVGFDINRYVFEAPASTASDVLEVKKPENKENESKKPKNSNAVIGALAISNFLTLGLLFLKKGIKSVKLPHFKHVPR